MKKVISIALAGAAVFALSGCSTGDGTEGSNEPNVKIINQGYTDEGYSQYTMVEVDNQSSYPIIEIWTAKGNDPYIEVHPPKTIGVGASRTFKSSNCKNYDEAWTIQVVDNTQHYAELEFNRQCGYKEHFTIVDNI